VPFCYPDHDNARDPDRDHEHDPDRDRDHDRDHVPIIAVTFVPSAT
jgi:hypothetical protein